ATIDISGLTSFLATLSPDEKDEQLRDWALYGLMSRYGQGAPDDIPIRHRALKGERPGEVSPGRVFVLSPREWWVIVPHEHLRDKPLIGGLVDAQCAAGNALPEKVSLFGYSYNAAAATIAITPAGTIGVNDLYSSAYGYASVLVRTQADFARFAGQVDDLVMAQWRSDGLLLGGRKYARDSRRALSVEEIAALYQAYNVSAGAQGRARYEGFLEEKYAETVRRDAKVRQALARGTTSKAAVMAKLRRRYPPASALKREESIGFSLDPQRDYPALAADVERIARQLPATLATNQPALAVLITSGRRELLAAAERIRSRKDIRPLIALRHRYQRSADPTEQRFGELLRYTEENHSYQAARYDGNIQGTRAAMILFYTDLLAKLWALDYKGMTPKGAIKGLRTMQQISVTKLHWNEMARLSQTRLWFGLRKDGFDVYGDRIVFHPIATRVYAASFDLMAPGKESRPNYQSREFLGWWDSHYEAVAEYEPYYHKLNQIQKWSALFVVLREKKVPLLDFLQGVPVTRSLDFATWSRNNTTLKAAIDIPFLESRKYGRTTECLPLLSSREYRLMGAYYALSGGVSLASRNDILAKLHQHDAEAPARAPSRRGATGAARSGNKMASTSHPPVKSGVQPVRKAVGGAKPSAEGGGTFRAEKGEKTIKLTWNKGPSVAMNDLVATLAARQQADPKAHKGEEVFRGLPDVQSVVRLKAGSAYLVKTAATKDKWIYLSVNPAKAAGYPAQAAADTPEADIFCARLVSAAEAGKLAAGKAVVR
ncbi:MAG TPA: hypothetical protein VI389_01660, partial [Geobacteraceae bacterium]